MVELELYRQEMQHFVNILQEYVINQILDISAPALHVISPSPPLFPSLL